MPTWTSASFGQLGVLIFQMGTRDILFRGARNGPWSLVAPKDTWARTGKVLVGDCPGQKLYQKPFQGFEEFGWACDSVWLLVKMFLVSFPSFFSRSDFSSAPTCSGGLCSMEKKDLLWVTAQNTFWRHLVLTPFSGCTVNVNAKLNH